MATGPSKYNDECTAARESTNAEAVVLLVLNGDRGTGFAVQAHGEHFSAALPDLLEHMAREIRRGAA
jgi:hypothetical protein